MNVFKNKCPHCTFCANNKAVLKMHLKNFHENQRAQALIHEKVNSDVINPKIYEKPKNHLKEIHAHQ